MTHSESEPEPAGAAAPAATARAPGAVPQRDTAASRIEGLTAPAIRALQVAARGLDAGDFDAVAEALRQARGLAPDHPEILRIAGVLEYRRGRFAEAIALFKRVLAAWPDDAFALGNLGSAYADGGRIGDALMTLRRACEVAPEYAAGWFNFGKLLDAQAHVGEAEKAFAMALERSPRHLPSRIAHANTLATLGRTDDAASEYRHAIAQDARSVQAWLGLSNLKTVRLNADEAAALERLHADATLTDSDRAVAGFALGKVLEDEQRYPDAFAVLAEANALRRRASPWNATAFSQQVDAITAAFQPAATAHANAATLGDSVIFVVSLPRSGSTLVEQILAAHGDVEGASELPDLESVILEESALRKRRFPEWVGDATAADWQRMGERYLRRTARWRQERPRFTDKMPDNWLLVGAALAMLPGARIVNVRRDAIETCWSCFKQLFGAGRHAYSYDLADLAEAWHDYDRLSRVWRERFPERVREQSYEALLADPEQQTRALLEFCGLPFDAATLNPHASARSVRTASAAQVREPMRGDTARTAAYGNLLEPLRRMLGAHATSATPSSEERAGTSGAQRNERADGLGDEAARDMLRAAALLGEGRIDEAATLIERVQATLPDHAETLRLTGALESARGHHTQARASLQRALALKPDDSLILNTFGAACAAAGDESSALASFMRARELDPHNASAHYNAGEILAARGAVESARAAFAQAIASTPAFVPARIALADTLRRLERIEESVEQLRESVRRDPRANAAWEALAELRPADFSAAERASLESEYQRPRHTDPEQATLAYALANVLEGRAQFPEAFAMFVTANTLRRRTIEWDAARHAQRCTRILDAFPGTRLAPSAATLGADCIFMLGLPGAAAVVVERVLRAHRSIGHVAAVNPGRIIAAESTRRGQKFLQWAPHATYADWQRIGRAYADANAASEATPATTTRSYRLLDTASFDIGFAGAVALMLPGARFVLVDGTALESCWSCFRRDFHGAQPYSYDFADLAAFRHDVDRLLRRWLERNDERIHRIDAATLRAEPEQEITRLFAFLDLDVEASALPIAKSIAERTPARAYGDLLKPLARMLDAGAANPTDPA